ncbi:MAG: hypothetical protein Unbinned1819contig1001_33 [Prokaryotic dsDNA virus sp.]|nr:MAG: hypothetical protein Unbinned1819contig1001_33 [Prokaryotic dsDNA virus sp.]|tara:strand:- start:19932 stop:20189 length:258 start_codon:yes stop_codon:yes gene_type:complete
MTDPTENQDQDKDFTPLADFVRLAVLTWSIAMLSLNYLGYVKAMDPTFPASLLTGTMASFGVNVGRANTKKKEDGTRLEQTPLKK